MKCKDCKKWEIWSFVSKFNIANQIGECECYGPGDINIKGDAYVEAYETNATDFCSKFEPKEV